MMPSVINNFRTNIVERSTDGGSADPDQKTCGQSEEERTSGSVESHERCPSHVRSHFNIKLTVCALSKNIYCVSLKEQTEIMILLCYFYVFRGLRSKWSFIVVQL